MYEWPERHEFHRSPPPTRGTHPGSDRATGSSPFTPARTGNTLVCGRNHCSPADNPRACGEHLDCESPYGDTGRSPPAARGTRTVSHPSRHARSDHPRTRGEHPIPASIQGLATRSPPRTWGTQHPPAAVAGRWPDHPHTCGEHVSSVMSTALSGRSPPAYAGNTDKPARAQLSSADHPRLRGEHGVSQIEKVAIFRSPPPTRGTHRHRREQGPQRPITPAYAGNIAGPRTLLPRYAAHPHARGEHQAVNFTPKVTPPFTPALAGTTRYATHYRQTRLPPRTWGTRTDFR